jgi:nucleoside-diphosphate-sugar epimerase
MTHHVVFGTGQVGRLVAEQLGQRGVEVVAVNRNGQGDIPGAQVVGGDASDPSFTTRAASGLITLATHPAAAGEIWHLPVAETRTTRRIIEQLYRLAGHRPRVFAAGRTTLRLAGVAKPALREYLHTLYQFTDRWVVDDGKFRDPFGDQATPVDDALATTLRWFRDRTASHQAA